MSLHPTDFCLPESGDEVVGLLEQYGVGALIVGGGTFIHGLDACGLLADVTALIDIQKLGLGTIESGPEGMRIGATTTCAVLAHEPAVRASRGSARCGTRSSTSHRRLRTRRRWAAASPPPARCSTYRWR